MANPESISRQPGLGLWVAFSVVSIVLLQIIAKRPESAKKPGPSRGDLTLQQDSLPVALGNWRQVGFRPAIEPNAVPEGIYWWVHQWLYQQENWTAIVSFDQLPPQEVPYADLEHVNLTREFLMDPERFLRHL